MKYFEQIEALESEAMKVGLATTPGTIISRCLLPGNEAGFGWTIGLGGINQPKKYFTAKTIEETIEQAQDWLTIFFPAQNLKKKSSLRKGMKK